MKFRYLINSFNFAKEDKIPLLDHCFDLVQVQIWVNGGYGGKT